MGITRNSRIREDTALGIILSVFFGIGLVVLTFVQKRPDAAQAGLDTFLFGQAATLLRRDVALIVGVGAAALLVLSLFWKEFSLLAFDPEFGASMGLPVGRVDILLTSLIVAAIVIGLQTVGVVLMSAMIVAPAAAARQWTDSLAVMVLLAGVFGAVSGVGGTAVSSLGGGISTGPTIVLVATIIVGISLLFAPDRGVASGLLRGIRTRRRVRADSILADLYALAVQHGEGSEYSHPVAVLRTMQPRRSDVERSLRSLAEEGWAREVRTGEWCLTPSGVERARTLFLPGEEVST
jgi:manganese/zinc/iron transport system permease protein